MKEVINSSNEEVAAYFNGGNIYFKAGQKKSFDDGVADEIVRENVDLSFEEEVEVAEVAEDAPEAIVEAPKAKGKRK